MKNLFFLLIALAVSGNIFAHSALKGKVLENGTNQPIAGALVQLLNQNKNTVTDAVGGYEFKELAAGRYYISISLLGYKSVTDTITIEDNQIIRRTIHLEEDALLLSEIKVTAQQNLGMNTLSSIDFKLRPSLTTQDLLRLVPGLFIGQHASGGKAEQLFLRGFDVDHGTDVAISVDNMPVNMVSHAHGQGYADLHFVIPETVDNMSFSKGPYDAKTGDFNTAGAVRFQTKNHLPQNMIKTEIGTYNTYRGVTMLNLFNSSDTAIKKQNAYIAAEYFYTNSFFQNPQDFNRVNLFGKYTGEINSTTNIAFTLSSFNSKWNASGQIPVRGVESGLIDKYGAVDPSEGGNTSRYNANLNLNKTLENGAVLQSNLYYINYTYNLYSNFTFYKNDTVNGDGINQYENRHVFGYNSSYSQDGELAGLNFKTVAGIGLRDDQINDIALTQHKNRALMNDFTKGDIHETNFNAHLSETVFFSNRLSLNLGLRFDNFHFTYRNKLSDTTNDVQAAVKSIVSPKLNLIYNATSNMQLYFSAGSGFHSNDARVAVTNPGNILPRALSSDVGTNLKIRKKIFVNAAIWAMQLESEYVWVGDEGLFEPSGKTTRIGLDFSARYQILPWLYADADLNLAKPKYVDEPEGQNYVPLAPPITSIAGINVRTKNGLTASLRYRYLGRRPAVEDNSVVAEDYFIMDAVAGYKYKNYQIGFTIENLLNTYWKETQFATESRLKGESAPVNEIHYTPGTPFNLRGNFTLFF